MNRLTIIEKMDYPEKSIEIRRDRMVTVEDRGEVIIIDGSPALDVRQNYEFAGKAIYLNLNFDWVLGVDSDGSTCLVPLKQK